MMVAMAALMGTAMAQTKAQIEQMQRERLEMFHKRDAAQHFNKNIPLGPATAASKDGAKAGLNLPADRWFPGEWEEVKAIVVTCYYNYYPEGHVGDQYWTADPMVTGVADYYHYNGGWQQSGSGPYVAIPDTANGSFQDVFFYLMDAIQMGGAEAWVRVEQLADSAIVKRKLDRMGLRNNNMRFIEGPGNSFWFRDCGPICFYYGDQDSVAMVDFEYYPGRALDDSLPSHIEAQMGIPNYITTIEWEGGNCLVDGAGMVLSSDAIYSNNMDGYGQLTWDGVNPNTINYTNKPALTRAQVKDSLAHILGTRATYILPTFKYDGGTGHVDLYADMWDENEFVFSIMPDCYSNWADYKTGLKNMDSLTSYMSYFDVNYKSHGIPFPSTNNGGTFSSQSSYNSNFTRTYSNHTFVNNVLVQPCFSAVVNGVPQAQWDAENLEVVKKAYPGYTVYPIDVRSFDGSGGAIHCITKQIPADNPIRILHPSITGDGNAYANSSATIRAEISNRSGISEAKCFYRIDGGAWQEVSLADNGGTFSGTIPTNTFTHAADAYNTVEYYIAATSNNGKTQTKPITAGQGGYYTFYMGVNMPLAIEEAESDMMGEFFPNPAIDKTSIRMNLGDGMHYNVQIVDAMGRTIHATTLDASGDILYNIDTHNFTKGIYSVVFTANNGERIVRRIVVQ